MSDLIIAVVPWTMIDLIWEKVLPVIKLAADKAPEDVCCKVVHDELLKGDKLLVAISRGADIVAVNVLDMRTLDTGIKILYIPITAGAEMNLWMSDFLEFAKVIAKAHGCVELRGLAVRNGWMKKLKPHGWEEMFTTIRCKLGE
jgi:hypothetical protein